MVSDACGVSRRIGRRSIVATAVGSVPSASHRNWPDGVSGWRVRDPSNVSDSTSVTDRAPEAADLDRDFAHVAASRPFDGSYAARLDAMAASGDSRLVMAMAADLDDLERELAAGGPLVGGPAERSGEGPRSRGSGRRI